MQEHDVHVGEKSCKEGAPLATEDGESNDNCEVQVGEEEVSLSLRLGLDFLVLVRCTVVVGIMAMGVTVMVGVVMTTVMMMTILVWGWSLIHWWLLTIAWLWLHVTWLIIWLLLVDWVLTLSVGVVNRLLLHY